MNEAILLVSSDLSDLENLSSSSTYRYKSYYDEVKCDEIDEQFQLQSSLLSTLYLEPIYKYIAILKRIYNNVSTHSAISGPEDEKQQASKTFKCMFQFACGLRYIFSIAAELGGGNHYKILLKYYNQSLSAHSYLLNVSLISILTRHTGLNSELQQLERLVKERNVTRLNTRQRETIRSERSMFVNSGGHKTNNESKKNRKIMR